MAISDQWLLILADSLLIFHTLLVAFVILGLVAVYVGFYRQWQWVRNLWFRLVHLLVIGIVVLQSWLGVMCPLTTWEMTLRQKAGGSGYEGSFIQHWLESILYYSAPGWVFILVYTVFGALVLMSWYIVRPRPLRQPLPFASMGMDRFELTSLIVWLAATVDAVGGLFGFWSVTGDERRIILGVEFAMLLVLLANSLALKNWVYRNTERPLYRQVAWLSVGSLALCIGGDLVNFNLTETHYRHGTVVKHDYLADSIWFFAPGYLLLLIAVIKVVRGNGMNGTLIAGVLWVAGLFGGVTIYAMHLPGTGNYVSAMTGFYGIFITAVGASGLLLVLSFGRNRFRRGVLMVAAGILLAAVADSIIGQFWIYGKGGEGHFPAARYLNWSLYIGSQCLVIHLARVSLWYGQCPGLLVNYASTRTIRI